MCVRLENGGNKYCPGSMICWYKSSNNNEEAIPVIADHCCHLSHNQKRLRGSILLYHLYIVLPLRTIQIYDKPQRFNTTICAHQSI